MGAFAVWCYACWSYCRCSICWPTGVIITSVSKRRITLASAAPSLVISVLRIGHVKCPSWWKVSSVHQKVAYHMRFIYGNYVENRFFNLTILSRKVLSVCTSKTFLNCHQVGTSIFSWYIYIYLYGGMVLYNYYRES